MRGNNQPREVQVETMTSKSEADADVQCLFKKRRMLGLEPLRSRDRRGLDCGWSPSSVGGA